MGQHQSSYKTVLATYYNEVRTHVSLGKDAPCTRAIERFGDIIAHPILGGLHHRYARICLFGSDSFHRIRHYGLLAKISAADNIARVSELLVGPKPQTE